ncbi:MAG: ACT domain-containing protein [Lachnospiraceae bacterium]|nr:ACT domain-containing protein [Lachnospiraceae bacterium]
MTEGSGYFVVKSKAVPEVLLKVVECKTLLESGKAATIQEATERTGISRSSFYKYKDDIFPFHDNAVGKTITFTCEMEDEPGILSDLLKIVADFGANVLTIHQSIPINNVASLSISLQILPSTGDISSLMDAMDALSGVRHVKILARE